MPFGENMARVIRRRCFTVDEYHRMGEAGILDEDSRVELIGGAIMVREPIGARHAGTVNRVSQLWFSRLAGRAIVQVQNPIEFREQLSELQPDVALLRSRPDFYADSHPVTDDVLLVIEVADSSLRLDRRVKIPIYARAGVPEAWLLDLTADQVEVYRAPAAERYGQARVFGRGASLIALAFPDTAITVDDLLG
jgi:hypothetical protein